MLPFQFPILNRNPASQLRCAHKALFPAGDYLPWNFSNFPFFLKVQDEKQAHQIHETWDFKRVLGIYLISYELTESQSLAAAKSKAKFTLFNFSRNRTTKVRLSQGYDTFSNSCAGTMSSQPLYTKLITPKTMVKPLATLTFRANEFHQSMKT